MINAQNLDRLLRKYEGHGPRYTSYPTALHFDESIGAEHYIEQVQLSNQLPMPRPLSLYLHVPFCQSLCYYCGCNKVVTRKTSRADEYVELLSQEISLRAKAFADDRLVQQIHFGGGTPTYLRLGQIRELLEVIAQSFHLGLPQNLEMGIELDPRTVSPEDLEALAGMGFNRFSLGIQDFDLSVQKAINREQSLEQVQALVDKSRELNVSSLSFDVIYGLPKQTQESFARSLEQVVALKPDRIALYNYAHMPQRIPSQRLIKTEDLPSGAEKLAIFSDSIIRLTAAGYEYIGMDHFALPEDGLSKALENGTLQRNFQGYSTNGECDLVGMGVSAISKVNDGYSQNVAEISAYRDQINSMNLPIAKGLVLGRDDLLRADLIQRVMCSGLLDYDEISQEHDVRFEEYFASELDCLADLAEDGLLVQTSRGFRVAELGRVFLRNIAMIFDAHLRAAPNDTGAEVRYSKTV